ncbi:MAG: hypothetical protein CRN43_05435, partial [Candidatus Nephrothrix sp. EaCA]
AYTGILEATGTRYDEGLNLKKAPGFDTDYYQFSNTRSAWFAKNNDKKNSGARFLGYFRVASFAITSLYMKFSLPWNT